MLSGWEAIMKALPDVYVDTSGYAFTFPLFKMFGKCKVGCYVHYPTISTDMLSQVRSRTSTYNNRSRISNSWLLSYLKFLYYKVSSLFKFFSLKWVQIGAQLMLLFIMSQTLSLHSVICVPIPQSRKVFRLNHGKFKLDRRSYQQIMVFE